MPPDAPAAPAPAPANEKASAPWCEVSASRDLAGWLDSQKVSLAFTTYKSGKLFFIGHHGRELSVFERTFSRCMGLWSNGQTLWMSSLYQLLRFENALRPGQTHDGYDRVYVPNTAHTTADLDVHEVAVESSGRVLFVNTKFSCISTLNDRYSFTPLWRPPFVSKLAPEDRCHMNGMALEGGKLRYVTVVSRSDALEGWRDRRRDGGCVLDVASGEPIVTGLSMPHSPRVYRGKLWVLEAGAGYLGYVDRATGKYVRTTFCPGYARGLSFVGDYAIVGLSQPRGEKTFRGLPLDEELTKRDAEARCGLLVIELATGDIRHWVRFETEVTELHDVVALQGAARPMALGFKNDDIARTISVGDPMPL